MRMRQSLAHFEEAFVEQAAVERARHERLRREAVQRSRQRTMERAHKQGSVRFVLLALSLVATAVIVTVAMFETLYTLLG